MRRRLLVLLTLAALTAAGCGLPGHNRSHQQTGTGAASLRAAFNASAADTRVLALVSPTCGTCLLGAATMEKDVFARISSTRLRGFIVWVPKLGAHQNDVTAATPTVPDPRATHYWDSTGYLVHAYPAVLGLGEDAWDIYLIYPPGVQWTGTAPPKPSYWMQQLTHASEPGGGGAWLNGRIFAEQVRTALKTEHPRG
ncbi:MAG: hypothetical protein ABJB47_20420 [Actinomycetota bacterium]